MSKNEQIKEMTEILKDYTKKNNIMASVVILEAYAEELYKANFCKQSVGEWVKDNNKRTCSLCGYLYYSNNDKFHYCPNCGAKMEGGTEQ